MTIQVHRCQYDNGRENCCHCGEPTAFWFEPKDVPLCPACAKKLNNHMAVPSKKEWLESLGYVLPEGWLPYVVTRDAALRRTP